jgi:uracil-DNA glycosylase family 4
MSDRIANIRDYIYGSPINSSYVHELMEQMVDPKCTACPIYKECTLPVSAAGSVDAEVMIIGRNPGVNEDAEGLPFIGRGGKLLDEFLGWIGLAREQVYITNLVKCYTRGNRSPAYNEIEVCFNKWLSHELEFLSPKLILTMGVEACWAMTGKQFKDLRGRQLQVYSRDNFLTNLIVCTHPGAGLRVSFRKENMKEEAKVAKQVCQQLGISLRSTA